MSKGLSQIENSWKQDFAFHFFHIPYSTSKFCWQRWKKGRSVGVKEWNQEEEKGNRGGKEGERKDERANESSRSFYLQWKLLEVLYSHSADIHLKLVFLNCFNDSLRKYQIQIFLSMIVTCLLLFFRIFSYNCPICISHWVSLGNIPSQKSIKKEHIFHFPFKTLKFTW